MPDGRIHLRQHRLPDALARVLFFHGNGEVVADYDDVAPKFAAAGAELWVADYRGYGQSEGVPTLRTLINDAHLIVAAVGGPLVVMGRSLGSAAAAELMGRVVDASRGGHREWRGRLSGADSPAGVAGAQHLL